MTSKPSPLQNCRTLAYDFGIDVISGCTPPVFL